MRLISGVCAKAGTATKTNPSATIVIRINFAFEGLLEQRVAVTLVAAWGGIRERILRWLDGGNGSTA
jgi:hypothetical protein